MDTNALKNPQNPIGAADSTISIARQAILDSHREIFAYELFDRSMRTREHSSVSDAQLLFHALSFSDTETQQFKRPIFINCTHESLAGGHLDLVAPERVVLEVPALPISQVDQIANRLPSLQEMQRRGFRLAFDYSILTRSYESWLGLASFIKFDLSVLKPEAVSSFIKLAQAKSNALLIAEKVETPAQYALVSSLGVGLYQGYWFAKPVIVEGQKIRPAQANILRLITLVRQQASTADIEEVLKHDPTLSFKLLRFINSAGFGARSEVTSFRHAVSLLGLSRLFKWAALLMTTSSANDTPPAVGTTAVVRGRLMELLAANILGPEDCDNAFVAGIFSLLDTMLSMSLKDALSGVPLPNEVTDALLHNTGVLAPFLALTIACESGDDAAFAKAATTLGLPSNQINLAHLEALAWAETMGQN